MQTDRYGLPLSTGSAAVRDAYVEAADLALTFYPGAAEAYDRAIAADPGFAMAHAGRAQMLAREGDVAAARAALAVAKGFVSGLSEREASHIAFFDLTFAGRTDDAIAALYTHLTSWPRDALVVSTAANPNGLLGASGRIGQKHQIAELMDSLAPHYGDDFWFLSYHAMAMSEDGRLVPARATIERSVAANPKNAHAAHGFAHICYESGALDVIAMKVVHPGKPGQAVGWDTHRSGSEDLPDERSQECAVDAAGSSLAGAADHRGGLEDRRCRQRGRDFGAAELSLAGALPQRRRRGTGRPQLGPAPVQAWHWC